MMTSNSSKQAYVWIWLPGSPEPVVAGQIREQDGVVQFFYAASYLNRPDRIAIAKKELPLVRGLRPLLPAHKMHMALRDASPDAWGRRVLINQKFGKKSAQITGDEMSEFEYLMESGSDRVGAIDFQWSRDVYEPRSDTASLTELLQAADIVEEGGQLTESLAKALQHGTSLGGARPKALIDDSGKKLIAKFSSSTDHYPVVKAEFTGMRLGERLGLNVAPVEMVQVMGKDVLLVERFDRELLSDGVWGRKGVISALSLLDLSEDFASHASYVDLTNNIRKGFANPNSDLEELYRRLVFNILIGNTDDHARNHAAMWNGTDLTLSPAYDLCPQARLGGTASQGMWITEKDRSSRLVTCLQAATNFKISPTNASSIIMELTKGVIANWDEISEMSGLSTTDRNRLWGGAFLNPYIFEDSPPEISKLNPHS